jgi:hypothetical protein
MSSFGGILSDNINANEEILFNQENESAIIDCPENLITKD